MSKTTSDCVSHYTERERERKSHFQPCGMSKYEIYEFFDSVNLQKIKNGGCKYCEKTKILIFCKKILAKML